MKFILIFWFLLFTTENLYAQNNELMEKFFREHREIKKDSLHYEMLLKYINQLYGYTTQQVVDSFIYEKSTKHEFESYSGISAMPCIKILLGDDIYLYVTARLARNFYDKPKYQDTTFIAKIYDHKKNITLHNFDIVKLNKQKIFTTISFEGDTIKFYINTSLRGKVMEEKGDCPYPYECIESMCHHFILKDRKVEYIGEISWAGYGKINKKEFFFKKIRHIYRSDHIKKW